MQFERRTEASVQARLLRPDTGEAPERIRIDRESEANHDLILWLDEPAGIWAVSYICKYLFSDGTRFQPGLGECFF